MALKMMEASGKQKAHDGKTLQVIHVNKGRTVGGRGREGRSERVSSMLNR